MLRRGAILVSASALYGFTVGAAHSWIYAARNLVKLPLLLVATGLVCSLAYYVVARVLVRISLRDVRELGLGLASDLSVLLASLSAPNAFVALVLRATDDDRLGEYSLFLGMNVVFVAVSGSLALVRQGRDLLERTAAPRARRRAVLACWLGLSLAVGGQAAFWLRPFFGLPASRGNVPPFALGAEPDVRGATNFYEMMLQLVTEPPLPQSWGGPARDR